MSTLSDAISAIREVMLLQADVKRAGDTLSLLSEVVDDHEKRLIRMETRWETAMEMRSLPPEIKQLKD